MATAPTGPHSCHFLPFPAVHPFQTLHPSGARHTPIPKPVVPVPNSQRSLNSSLSRLSSSQLRTTWAFLLRVFFFFQKKQVLLCLVVGGGGFQGRTNFGPAQIRSRQDLPLPGALVVDGVSCWVRSKRKRRGSV